MKRHLFDTNIFISYKQQVFGNDKLISNMALSLVVLCELTYSASDRQSMQMYEKWRRDFYKDGLLLVPSMMDYWDSAKKTRALKLQEEKDSIKIQRGRDDAIRLQNDALIAYTVSQEKDCFVVTNNVQDFTRLQRVIDFQFMPAAEFFG